MNYCPRCTGLYHLEHDWRKPDPRRTDDRGRLLCYGCSWYLDQIDSGVKPQKE